MGRPRGRRRAAARWATRLPLFLFLAGLGAAEAAVVAPPPGRQVRVRSEEVLLVFDPLTASQTILVRHTFEGTTTPFGLLIPTPAPARVTVVSERLHESVQGVLHPRASLRRSLDLELDSWLAGCVVREVGDRSPLADAMDRAPPAARGEAASLGSAPEPLHDWLLANGFTLAPAQSAWLADLRARGWSVVGVVVRPPRVSGPPPALRGPVLALTHEAEEPVYAAGQPPFALTAGAGEPGPPLEVAVLSEWAVRLVPPGAGVSPEPFFADTLTGRQVTRLGARAGGLPWAFRRNGSLTAFRLDRPAGRGVLRFVRTEPWPRIRPDPLPRQRTHRLRIPVELPLLVVAGVVLAWRRSRRRSLRGRGGRLRF